jgi:hypothetical protein
LCVPDPEIIPERDLLSCISWNDSMKVRKIDMAMAVQIHQIASGTVRHSVLDLARQSRARSLRSDLSELIIQTAQSSCSLPDFLEGMNDLDVFPEVRISPCEERIEWIRFTYEGKRFRGAEMHFGIGEIRSYGLTFDPAMDIERVRRFLAFW